MIKKYSAILIAMILTTAFTACISTSSDQNTPSKMIVGLWELTDKEGTYKSYEFSDQGKVIVDNLFLFSYEFASDSAIAIRESENQDIYKLLAISKITNNDLVLVDDIWEETYTRIKPITNPSSKIIGFWQAENQRIVEFTSDGKYLDNFVSHYIDEGEFYSYEVFENTIAVYENEQKNEPFFIRLLNTNNNVMEINFGQIDDNNKISLNKMTSYPNLAKDIIGIWSNNEGEKVWEFTENGTVINYMTNSIDTYNVISGNTFSYIYASGLDVFNYVVIDFTGNKMTLNLWFPPDLFPQDYIDQLVFTKVK